MNIIRKLINQQLTLSERFDELFLPKKLLIDGNGDYLKFFLPDILKKMPILPKKLRTTILHNPINRSLL